MPYSDPDKQRESVRNYQRSSRGYKRGDRLQVFLQEFTDLESQLQKLEAPERLAIDLYYGLRDGIPHSLQEIGDRLECSRENARLIKDKALQKLREKVSENT